MLQITVWKNCVNDKNSFDIVYPLKIAPITLNHSDGTGQSTYLFDTVNLNVLTHSDVCSFKLFDKMNWNKCIRTILYKWCNILVLKIIILFFMPLFIVIKKTLKYNCFYSHEKDITLSIDSELTMVTTNLEIILVFCIFCPLLYNY